MHLDMDNDSQDTVQKGEPPKAFVITFLMPPSYFILGAVAPGSSFCLPEAPALLEELLMTVNITNDHKYCGEHKYILSWSTVAKRPADFC